MSSFLLIDFECNSIKIISSFRHFSVSRKCLILGNKFILLFGKYFVFIKDKVIEGGEDLEPDTRISCLQDNSTNFKGIYVGGFFLTRESAIIIMGRKKKEHINFIYFYIYIIFKMIMLHRINYNLLFQNVRINSV